MGKKFVGIGFLNIILLMGVSPADAQAWGGGGGPFIMQFSPDLGELNRKLNPVVGSFEGGIRMIGGGGLAGVSRNVRLGGLGAGGSKKIEGNGREAELSIGYGGFLAEYVLPLGRIQCFLGGVIGWGSIDLRLSRANWNMSWNDFWNDFEGDSLSSNDYSGHLTSSFFCYEPYVGLQLAFTQWLYLRGSIGYFGANVDKGGWKESGIKLHDSPAIDISNYRAQVFLLFGWFGG